MLLPTERCVRNTQLVERMSEGRTPRQWKLHTGSSSGTLFFSLTSNNSRSMSFVTCRGDGCKVTSIESVDRVELEDLLRQTGSWILLCIQTNNGS